MQTNNVCEYLIETANRYPNKVAITDGTNKMTFAELLTKVKAISKSIFIATEGVKNTPVSIYMDKSIDMIAAYLGVAYSGNYYSPIDKSTPAERVQKIVDTLEPSVIIYDSEIPKEIKSGAKAISYKDAIESDAKEDYRGYESVLDIDPLYVLFTSGSTGVPKGVVISHRSVIDYAEWLHKEFAFDENTVFGNQAPFYFDNSVLDIYSMVKNGSTMVIIPTMLFSFYGKLLEFIKDNHINTIFWVPSALIGLANSGALEEAELASLKKILFCGEVMPNKQLNILRRAFPDSMFANLYGPTEITDVCTCYVVDREFQDVEPLPIGKPCRNMDAFIVDESNKEVVDGGVGELCIRGIGLAKGYYGNKDITNKVFVQNPLHEKYTDIVYKTGDLAKYNEYGEIIFLGRKDYQIKHQGHRIELGEIETAGYSYPGVENCCALYDETNKKIVLYASLNKQITDKELYKYLKEKIPKYMLPGIIRFLDKLPMNANGKIDRVALKRMLEADNENK